jgi:hypothetical protein
MLFSGADTATMPRRGELTMAMALAADKPWEKHGDSHCICSCEKAPSSDRCESCKLDERVYAVLRTVKLNGFEFADRTFRISGYAVAKCKCALCGETNCVPVGCKCISKTGCGGYCMLI